MAPSFRPHEGIVRRVAAFLKIWLKSSYSTTSAIKYAKRSVGSQSPTMATETRFDRVDTVERPSYSVQVDVPVTFLDTA